jgi:hypothetical protein
MLAMLRTGEMARFTRRTRKQEQEAQRVTARPAA